MKDFLEFQGVQNLYGSRDTTREAFNRGLIENGEVWMDMIAKRNLTSHTYDEATADRVADSILNTYFVEFETLLIRFAQLKQEESL